MEQKKLLPRAFYDREVIAVARDLLGKSLVRQIGSSRISGFIIETEAYRGEEDQACHARVGKTQRNAVMFGPPGYAYIYFTYGMHWLLNCVCSNQDFPAAVLIRSVLPIEGKKLIEANRMGKKEKDWCNGPAKICQAFRLTGQQNGIDITQKKDGLWIEEGRELPESFIQTGPRVGLGNTPEPWLSMPWRFWVKNLDFIKEKG